MGQGLQGADTAALLELGQQVDAAGASLREAHATLRARLYQAPWIGDGADRFRAEWDGVHADALLGAAERLGEVGGLLRREAGEQDAASAAGAGAGLSAGASAGVTAAPMGAAGLPGVQRGLQGPAQPSQPAEPSEKVKKDLERFRSILKRGHGWNGNEDDLQEILKLLQGMTPEEREQFVQALTAEDLALWNRNAGKEDGWFSDNGLSDSQRRELANALLPGLSAASVRKLTDGMPTLAPDFHDLDGGKQPGSYTWPPGSLGADNALPGDINQGGAGDCWFLSSLAAQVKADPNFVAEHLKDNGNGTYTVTFYRDGHPVEVTVDGSLPTDGGRTLFAHGDKQWPAIYEKAFAQFKGSYGDTEGGWGDQGLEALTGKDAQRQSPSDVSFDDIRKSLDAHKPVTIGTTNDKTWGLWGDDDHRVDNKQLVSNHEYWVEGVEHTDKGDVLVIRNPWGPGAGAPDVVRLTESEYRKWVNEVSTGA